MASGLVSPPSALSAGEANWTAFRYFNFYRLIVILLSMVLAQLPWGWADPFYLSRIPALNGVALAYLLAIFAGMVAAERWSARFDTQLSLQIGLDIAAVGVFMYHAGGVASGLGVLLLVSLAGASLVGQGRLVLLYAALATLVVLSLQLLGVSRQGWDFSSVLPAGLMSAGFFATAVLARLLGARVAHNEALARRHAEALIEQERINECVIERMQDGVLVLDSQGVVRGLNPVAGQLLPGVVRGLPLAACVPALPVELAVLPLSGQPLSRDFDRGDGRLLRARGEPTGTEAGYWLLFIEDMERITVQAQQLKLASLGRLTASIAHEIRNPLAAIGHAGELLYEEEAGVIRERLLRIIGDNVGRLDRIVRQVLDMGRREPAHPAPIPLAPFFADFAEQLALAEGLAPGVLQVETAPGLAVRFDPTHLHRVLSNLVSNALRFCHREAGSVCLSARATADGRVSIEVVDDGPGVPPALQPQVFEPFFTTQGQGTGLGLFIARELCEANAALLTLEGLAAGGHFRISAEQGQGDEHGD